MNRSELISDFMLEQNQLMHQAGNDWGNSGWRHGDNVKEYARLLRARSILDYGCGRGTLRQQLKKRLGWQGKVLEYDPAIPKKSGDPVHADLVVCTDVLEHVEKEKVHAVLQHICSLAVRGIYLNACVRPALAVLPCGQNAHITLETPKWWRQEVKRVLTVRREEVIPLKDGNPGEIRFWATP